MPLHFRAWSRALGEYGCVFPEATFYAWGGRPIAEIITALNAEQGLAMPVALVAERKEEFYYELLGQLTAVPEVLEVIEREYGRVPFAVVSGSTRESVVASLEKLGLVDRFEVMVCAGDYKRAKPDPEPFLMAAARLGIRPEECLVFEDTEMGVASAKAGGMGWVMVPGPLERQEGATG